MFGDRFYGVRMYGNPYFGPAGDRKFITDTDRLTKPVDYQMANNPPTPGTNSLPSATLKMIFNE